MTSVWLWRVKKWLRRKGVLWCQCHDYENLAKWEIELLYPCMFCDRQEPGK